MDAENKIKFAEVLELYSQIVKLEGQNKISDKFSERVYYSFTNVKKLMKYYINHENYSQYYINNVIVNTIYLMEQILNNGIINK